MALNTLSVLSYSGDKLSPVFVNDVALQRVVDTEFSLCLGDVRGVPTI